MSSQSRYDITTSLAFHEQRKASTLLAEQYSPVLTASPSTFPDRKDVALCNATGGHVSVPLPVGDDDTIGLVYTAVKVAADGSGNAVAMTCPIGQTFPGGATSISTTTSGGRISARWNGLHWQNVSPGSSGGSLPAPGAAGEVLRSDGGAWSSAALAQSDVTGLSAALAAKAPLASPAFTGNPTAPTPAPGDNDTSIATTAFVSAVETAVTAYTDAAVSVEAAARSAADALLAPLASPALTGTPTAPTPSATDNSTKIATTAFVASKRYAGVFGDGVTSSLNVAHGLGTTDVIVQVRSALTGIVDTQAQITVFDANNITLDFVAPPDINSLRVVVSA